MAYYNSRPDTLPDGPQPDGTYRLNGAVVSAADHAAAMATRGTNAALDAQARGQAIQTGDPAVRQSGYPIPPGLPHSAPPPSAALPPGMPPGYGPGVQPGYGGTNADAGINVNSYVGSRYSPDFAWSNPQLFTPPTGLPPVTADTLTQRQQLADANGKIPGRHYDPANIAAASPEWLASETAMLPSRLATVAAGQDRDALSKTLAGMPPGYEAPPPAGQPPGMPPAGAAPAGAPPSTAGMPPVDRGQEYLRNGGRDLKTAEYLTKASAPAKVVGGFGTAKEALDSIPPGYKGSAQQNAEGRWLMNYEPVPAQKTQPTAYDKPKIIETNGVKFMQSGPGRPWTPLAAANAAAMTGDDVKAANQSLAELNQEKADHQVAIANGSTRYSSGHLDIFGLSSRAGRIHEIDRARADLLAKLGGNAASDSQTPPAPAPAAPTKPAAPIAAAKPAQGKLYAIDGNQILFAHGDNMLNSVQQALDDGYITADSARTILRNAKFPSKAKK